MTLLLLAACAGSHDDTAPADTDTAADTSPPVDTGTYDNAAVTIDAPSEGTAAYGWDPLELTWTVTGLVMDAAGIGGANDLGHGHAQVFLDGALQDNTAGSSWVFRDLASGDHTLGVALVENDGTALPASDEVTVNIVNPAVTIDAPVFETALDVSATRLQLSVSDFTISDDVDGAAVFDEGHAHVYVDGTYLDYTTSLSDVLVPRLAEGDHTISVVLATSDHDELEASASVAIAINAGAKSLTLDTTPFPDGTLGSATLPATALLTNVDLADGSGVNVYLDGVLLEDTSTGSATLRHVTSGAHWLEARLHDATGLELGADDYARVTIADDAKDVTITAPTEGAVVTGDFTLSVTPANFTLDAENMGGANVAGTGHYVVWIDGVQAASSAGDTLIPALAAGEHTIEVQLVNNDETALSPAVSDLVHVTGG